MQKEIGFWCEWRSDSRGKQIGSVSKRAKARTASMRCTEEGSESEQVGKDTGGGYFGPRAGASYDHRLSVVARRLEAHDVVTAGQVCEGMGARVALHFG